MANGLSILTSRVTKKLAIPGTDDTAVIRRLNPKQLHQAGLARTKDAIGQMSEVYGEKRVHEIQDRVTAQKAEPSEKKPETPSDPLAGFDIPTLMEKAVIEWSIDAPLELKTFEDVDADTAEWFGREILMLAKPSLYQSKDEQKAAEKNG